MTSSPCLVSGTGCKAPQKGLAGPRSAVSSAIPTSRSASGSASLPCCRSISLILRARSVSRRVTWEPIVADPLQVHERVGQRQSRMVVASLGSLGDGGDEANPRLDGASEEPRVKRRGESPPVVEVGVKSLLAGQLLRGQARAPAAPVRDRALR